jgi:cytoskeletal protein RodZ
MDGNFSLAEREISGLSILPMPTIGEMLREARAKKGVSEEVAARASKIKLERLHDLEQDRYDQFAAHIYARSFLRLYSEYLGLDIEAILKRFAEEYPAPPPKPVFEITEEQRACSPLMSRPSVSMGGDSLTPAGKIVLAAAIVIFLLLAVATFWVLRAGAASAEGNSRLPPSSGIAEPLSPAAPETLPSVPPVAVPASPAFSTNTSPIAPAARSR